VCSLKILRTGNTALCCIKILARPRRECDFGRLCHEEERRMNRWVCVYGIVVCFFRICCVLFYWVKNIRNLNNLLMGVVFSAY